MSIETVYRFELAFQGEAQCIGVLQGLNDTPVPTSIKNDLYHRFDSLPVPPDLYTDDDSPVVFWFRKAGLSCFADAINLTIQQLEPYDWQVLAMPLRIDTEDSLYLDEYQVAFSYSDLSGFIQFNYKEISCVDSDKSSPLVYPNPHPSLDRLIQTAAFRTSNEAPTAPSNSIKKTEWQSGGPSLDI